MLLCEAQEWAHVFPGSIQLRHNKQTGSEWYGKLDYLSIDWEKTCHARSLNIHVSHLCQAWMEQGHKVTSLFIYSVPLDLILVQHDGSLCSSELCGSGACDGACWASHMHQFDVAQVLATTLVSTFWPHAYHKLRAV
jgi:hypothetical protein